jgi:HSP20 family protein
MSLLPTVRRTPGSVPRLFDDVDRLTDLDAWYGFPSNLLVREGLWHPTMDIYNKGDNLVVELEMPGIKEGDIDISIEQDHLVVTGSRKQSSEHKEGDQYYLERSYGKFHRVVHLPESVDESKVTASLKEGLLTVTLPKKKKEAGKKVKVESK